MRIAFFTNKSGTISDLQNSHEVNIYEKTSSSWVVIQSLPTNLNASIDLITLRVSILKIIKKLSPCTIIVSRKMIGLGYNLFSSRGFHIWEYDGDPLTHLFTIEQDELISQYDLNKTINPFSYYKTQEEGYYSIDVKSILFHDPYISSKKLLIPFLEHHPFYELQITFSHIPPWFAKSLEKRNMEMEILVHRSDRYVIVVRTQTCLSQEEAF